MRTLERIAEDLVYLADMGEEEHARVAAMTPSEQVRHCYVSGECHVFAAALHRITGWPVVSLDSPEHGHFHRAVRAPDGRLLDAAGWTDEAGLKSRYRLRKLTFAEVRDPEDVFDCFSAEEDGTYRELADAVFAVRQLPWPPFCDEDFRSLSGRPVEGADGVATFSARR